VTEIQNCITEEDRRRYEAKVESNWKKPKLSEIGIQSLRFFIFTLGCPV
jgi:hypothetical protein